MSELTTPKRTRIVYTDKTRKWFETLFNSHDGGRFSPLVKDGLLSTNLAKGLAWQSFMEAYNKVLVFDFIWLIFVRQFNPHFYSRPFWPCFFHHSRLPPPPRHCLPLCPCPTPRPCPCPCPPLRPRLCPPTTPPLCPCRRYCYDHGDRKYLSFSWAREKKRLIFLRSFPSEYTFRGTDGAYNDQFLLNFTLKLVFSHT